MNTSSHFDYQIFKDSDGTYFARIRSTGEVTPISGEVCRELRREEKRASRYRNPGLPPGDALKGALSLDDPAFQAGRPAPSFRQALTDPCGGISRAELRMDLDRFRETLSPVQKRVFQALYVSGLSQRECAELLGIAQPTVLEIRRRIAKKAKKFFGEP